MKWKMQEKKEVEQKFEIGDYFYVDHLHENQIRQIVQVRDLKEFFAAIDEDGDQVNSELTITELIDNYDTLKIVKVEPFKIKDEIMYFREV